MPSEAFKSAQWTNTVNAAVCACNLSFPADCFEVWEFAVCPFFDVFADVFEVILAVEFEEFFAFWVDYADFAVVEVDFVVFVNHAHVVGWHGVGLAFDYVDIFGVA